MLRYVADRVGDCGTASGPATGMLFAMTTGEPSARLPSVGRPLYKPAQPCEASRAPAAATEPGKPMSTTTATTLLPVAAPRGRAYARHYWMFAVPAAIVVLVVILFPWVFTLFMSVHEWKVSGTTPFVGLANYAKMWHDERFQWAVIRTLEFTAASVVAPVLAWGLGCGLLRFQLQISWGSPEPCSCCR